MPDTNKPERWEIRHLPEPRIDGPFLADFIEVVRATELDRLLEAVEKADAKRQAIFEKGPLINSTQEDADLYELADEMRGE